MAGCSAKIYLATLLILPMPKIWIPSSSVQQFVKKQIKTNSLIGHQTVSQGAFILFAYPLKITQDMILAFEVFSVCFPNVGQGKARASTMSQLCSNTVYRIHLNRNRMSNREPGKGCCWAYNYHLNHDYNCTQVVSLGLLGCRFLLLRHVSYFSLTCLYIHSCDWLIAFFLWSAFKHGQIIWRPGL